MGSNRRTLGVSFNISRPEERELLFRICEARSISDLIKRALFAYFDRADRDQLITPAELNDLRARLAYLEQQPQQAASVIAGDQVVSVDTPGPGRPLSDQFKAAVIKTARPGLRLEDV